MKKLIASMTMMAAIAVAPVFAASATLRGTIPFEFVVNGKVLPAGEYTISDSMSSETVQIRGVSDPKQSAIALTAYTQSTGQGDPTLSFRNVNGKHYLVTISRAGSAKDVSVPTSVGGGTLTLVRAAVR